MASDALAFRNVVLYVDGEQLEGDLLVVGDRIDGVGQIKVPPDIQDRDLHDRTIAPGLIDLQINGLTGVEVYEATQRALRAISAICRDVGLPLGASGPSVYTDSSPEVDRQLPSPPGPLSRSQERGANWVNDSENCCSAAAPRFGCTSILPTMITA